MTRSTDSKIRRMTPPSPTYMTDDQFAKYLADLRANRTARPGGARPQPSRQGQHRQSLDAASQATAGSEYPRPQSQAPSIATLNTGRDYYPSKPTVPLKPSEVVPTATYMERGQRWMEKEEAVSLREAMQDMEIRRPSSVAMEEDEHRLYNAALDEAAELVWQHQHGGPQPRPDGPYRYRSHLRKNSYAHARTASLGSQGDEVAPSGLGRDVATRSVSLSSTESLDTSQPARKEGNTNQVPAEAAIQGGRSYGNAGAARRRTSLKKDICGEIQRPFSGDQIWEEPEASTSSQATTASPGRVSPDKLHGKSLSPMNLHDKWPVIEAGPRAVGGAQTWNGGPWPGHPCGHQQEAQGPQRQATGAHGRQRQSGPAYYQPPTQVSPPCHDAHQPVDIPRFAISEAETTQPREISHAGVPSIAIAGPEESPDPTISEPTIMTGRASQQGWSSGPRPLPTPSTRSRGHWSPAPGATARSTAVCHQCGLSIDGSCKTSLETMEISPEPERVRAERLQRIRLRAAGQPVEQLPGKTAADDGDERLRFFCHLDWHELFAPRCKHCKTPIIGEHIVALGHHWHYGHFFCAECGDSFGQGMTHIEKDGYAWCVNCQTKRTERRAPKCRKCRQPVIGQYIQALGGEWHENCFRCAECQGGFDDGPDSSSRDDNARDGIASVAPGNKV
ncbi:hypothetical protein XA68_13786 [Ophiocordyceps unilateralis]|uniref:LIM zinc-binding domain-containing protein n=1 Tax=Ophiocordyceps unilateralis TaxID=268505 RepID=A0A2A9PPT1_OPHUN|nr:hypothetical protein XA68_13786 [Ophiocordyceps unilateralis]